LIASKNIGEREVVEKTWGWAAGKPTSNYQRVIKPYFPAFKLRKLPKFTAIVRHCERPFRKRLIPPINPDGSHPKWVHMPAARLRRLAMAEIRRVQTREFFMNANSAAVQDLNGLEAHLLSRIKGQDHVIPRVCSVLDQLLGELQDLPEKVVDPDWMRNSKRSRRAEIIEEEVHVTLGLPAERTP
jgi:hypothetical protein